ncbi:MAG: hypothetical protein PHN45_10570 [Methylococcales bacterium]|nr:hypothetical protein [Methylococcales bacterium]MDD5755180.1 hypothetical protein [Methylococcales bacterium]
MISNKKVGMNEILSELNVVANNVDRIYHFNMKAKFFVGGDCEIGITSFSEKVIKPNTFKNIAICSETMTTEERH